jgi:hypothetical protein
LQPIEEFFVELDASWDLRSGKIRLPLFGCGALLLQTDYKRLTKDGDILETLQHTPIIQSHLKEMAGKGTKLHQRHRLYLEIVASGIPFLPHVPLWHPLDLPLQWFEVATLDVVDVVVSKLARFHADDRGDIDAMVKRGLVPHARFVSRFRDAVDERSTDARADQLPTYVERFHTVERDMIGVDETPIHLPSWI